MIPLELIDESIARTVPGQRHYGRDGNVTATATAKATTWKVTAIVLGVVLAVVLLLVAAVFLTMRGTPATANTGGADSSGGAGGSTELM